MSALLALLILQLPVTVGYEENYPLSYTDGGGNPSGLYIELFREIAEERGWEPVYVPGIWPDLIRMLQAGEIDLIACMTRTPEREEIFLFPEESVEAGWSILLVRKDGGVPSLGHLGGKTVALIEGDIHSITLMELISRLEMPVDTVMCGSYGEGIEAVLAGRADAVPVPKNIMLTPDFPEQLAPQGIVWSPMAATFAGNRVTSREVIDGINGSLASLKADSSSVFYSLMAKWLSPPEHRNIPGGYYFLLGILLLALIAVILLTNRRLAREVRLNRHALANSRSLAEIALLTSETDNLDQLYDKVSELLRRNLKAENFYLALHNPENGTFNMPLFHDEREEVQVLDEPESFTKYVFDTGEPLMLNRREIRRMIDDPSIPVSSPEDIIPWQFIAVPMKAGEEIIGVIAFQSYDEPNRFTEEDLHFITSVSGHIGSTVLRLRAWEEVGRNRKRQKMLLDFDPTGIFLLDRMGVIVDCNRKATEFAELPETRLRGRTLSEFLRDSEGGSLDPIRTHDPDVPSHFTCGFRGAGSTGYSVEGIVNSFIDDEVLFHFVTIIDITEKSMLEKEAMRNERLESIGLLAGGIAHDFNNILTGIMGSLSLLHDTSRTLEERTKLIVSAENAARRARSLTGQLLTFAKGGSPIRKSVDTGTVLRDVAEFVLRGSSVLLELEVEQGTWNLNVDIQQFGQVLQNIVTNARQAMKGNGRLYIRAKNFETPRGQLVLIEFEDTGPGIPRDIIENVFDPYFTTKTGGHGLGLATSFSIIQRHGGTIKAGNGFLGGALFSLLVPASSGIPEKTSEVPRPEASKQAGKILVLDDDESVLETAGEMLRSLGYSCDSAFDGLEAIEMYKDAMNRGEQYTAVIMDLTIPGGTGGAQAVKQVLKLHREAVVIVSSGYAGNDVMANYREHGFRGVLAKPYTIGELSESLTSALKNRGEWNTTGPGSV